MSGDLWTVKQALERLPSACRFHREDFGRMGYLGSREGGEPRCEGCRPAWRRMAGLAALARVEGRLDVLLTMERNTR